MKSTNLKLRMLEKIFDTLETNEIPRQFVGILGSLPGFAMGLISAWDHLLGTIPFIHLVVY